MITSGLPSRIPSGTIYRIRTGEANLGQRNTRVEIDDSRTPAPPNPEFIHCTSYRTQATALGMRLIEFVDFRTVIFVGEMSSVRWRSLGRDRHTETLTERETRSSTLTEPRVVDDIK